MRSPTRARLTFAALTCGAALTLAACGDPAPAPPLGGGTTSASVTASPGPSPSATDAASTEPSASTPASPTPTPSTKPGGGTVTKGGPATGKAADAAKTIAQTFVAADNAATRSGTFAARDKVTASSCIWCANKKSFVRTIYAGGGRIEGEVFTKNTFTVAGPSNGVYTVVVNTTVSRYREINGAGKVTDSRGDRAGLLTLQVGASKVVAASWQPRG